MRNVKSNFVYNVIYQVLAIIIPFITTPYVARTLGASGIGIQSYTYSTAGFFALFIMLGITNYGNREIAKAKEAKAQLNKTFFSIYTIQLLMGIIVMIAFNMYVFILGGENKLIFYFQNIYILAIMFDITWFYFGMEEFKKTVIRNSIIKLVSFMMIFLLVKNSNDLIIYTIIIAGSNLAGNLFLFLGLRKYVDWYKIKWQDLGLHIKPCLLLFIPVIAWSIYRIMDKIMLGMICDIKEVGYYENAEKIINMPLSFISALGTVLLPRMANMLAKGEKVEKYFIKAIEFTSFLVFPIAFGLNSIATEFVTIFLGEDFIKSAMILKILSITLIFIAFSSIIKTTYLIPKEKDREFTISLSVGAIINLIFNLILIPRMSAMGATIATLFAEFMVFIIQLKSVKLISMKEIIKKNARFLISAIIMFIILQCTNQIVTVGIISVLLKVVLGVSVYLILNYKYIISLIVRK